MPCETISYKSSLSNSAFFSKSISREIAKIARKIAQNASPNTTEGLDKIADDILKGYRCVPYLFPIPRHTRRKIPVIAYCYTEIRDMHDIGGNHLQWISISFGGGRGEEMEYLENAGAVT